ncbi:hypothetical protein ACIQ9P_05945 [Kitasatospora sp. NPDC094019]|uniref:hypothetical protein n=1 Tax=Kitasatospora sp. NPDC094019 TaxID=3364091 RepID=UPI0037F6DB84
MTDRPGAPFDGLGERLHQGDPLERILLDLIGPGWREVLRHCSVVPDFTEDLYRTLLCTVPDGPAVTELLDHGLLEPAARPGRYRIAETLRFACWDSWWRDSTGPATEAPAALRRLAVRLAADSADCDDEPGWLRHLAIAGELDPGTFRAAFDEADRRLDLARCQDLVNAVTDPQVAPLLQPAIGRTVAEARVRIRARALWRPAYHQSAGYFRRPRADEPLLTLLAERDPRLLRLQATGGSGKSMLLRWFMARYCQQLPVPVPCAYLDFDHCDPALAVTHPWLLVLEAAAQLNEQLVDTPFDELLASRREYLALLPRNRDRAADAGLGRPGTGAEGEVTTVGDFIAVLHETLDRRRARAVLVLDTLEEVTLRDGAQLDGLANVLERLLAGVPELRIVVSGRYDLSEALPLRARALRLDPFDPEEADAYLRDVRSIDDPALRRAIAESGDGLPYTLALFADLAADLTPEQIRSASGPGLLYAIDRVLERVHDDRLRWLLRYGVIPRRLSLSIVQEVMLPHLRQGIRGSGTADDPGRDERPVMRFPIFLRAEPGFTDEADELPELWAALTRYAGDSVWVGRDPRDPDGLVIDRTVRDPLRALLADHPVSKLLDRDLAEYFAHRARTAEGSTEWVRWTVEEYYHRFSGDQQRGAEAWARLVGEPGFGEPDPSLVQLAEEVLQLAGAGELTLPPDALARAVLIVCRAVPEGGDHHLLLETEAAISAGPVGREVRRAIELTAARQLIRLDRLAGARRRLAAAAADLDLAAPGTVAEYHRLTGAVALAAWRGDLAQQAFERADRVLRPTGGEVAAETRADVARLLDAGWVGYAAHWLPRLDARSDPELYLRLLLAVGRPTEALAAHASLGPAARFRTTDQAALAALRLHRPAEVLALTDPSAWSPPGATAVLEGASGSLLARGAAHVMLRAPVREVTALTEQLAAERLPASPLAILLLRTAQLLDTAGGNREEVRLLILRARRLAGAGPDGTAADLLAELAWWPEEAPGEPSVFADEPLAAAPLPFRVGWLVGALAHGRPQDHEAFAGELIDALGPLGRAEARLVALERLDRVPGWLRLFPETAERLTGLCTPDVRWTDSADAAALGLTYAELLRLVGRPREASDLARACAEELARTESAVWLRYLDRTVSEVRRPGDVPEDLADVLRRDYDAFPEAAAAVLTEQALHGPWKDGGTGARTMAVRAWLMLKGRPGSLTKARCAGAVAVTAAWSGGTRPEVQRLARRSLEVYEELGRPPEERYRPTTRLGSDEPEPAVEWHENVLQLDGGMPLSRRVASLSLQFLESTGPGARRRLTQRHAAAPEWLGGLDALHTALSGSPAGWVEEAGALVGTVLPGRTGPGQSNEPRELDLRLEAAVGQEALLAAPWEAVVSPEAIPVLRRDRTFVYRGLAGHPTEAAALGRLRALAEDVPGGTPPTDLRDFVAHLWGLAPRPVRVGVLARGRADGSSEHFTGRSAMSHLLVVYENHRSVRMVDPTRRGDRRGLPQLVHVQGTFHEKAADPRIRWDPREDSNAAGLGEFLGVRSGPNPVVVLEALDPGTHHEAVRQVLLRNLFAAELLARGEVSAVLAIGPFPRSATGSELARWHFVERLVEGVHPALALKELTRDQVRAEGPPMLTLPALFSTLPTDLLVPLWASA